MGIGNCLSSVSAVHRVLIAGGLLALSTSTTAFAGAQQPDPRLYLMRNLEHTLNNWHAPTDDPRQVGEWVFITRNRLTALRATASAYFPDPELVGAYDTLLAALNDYQRFVEEVVLYDLVGNVARPEQQDFKTATGRVLGAALDGAETGRNIGMVLGTVTLPGVGTVAGGKLGAATFGVAAGGAAYLECLGERDEAIRTNARISDALRSGRLELLNQTYSRFASSTEAIKVHARILAGTAKYGWGDQVGFDGAETLGYPALAGRRPRDPFVRLGRALEVSASDPLAAARLLEEAARLVPADADRGVDIFDRDRFELFGMAVRLADLSSRRAQEADRGAADLVIRSYREARSSIVDGDESFPRDLIVAYARALATVGGASEARGIARRLQSASPDDPFVLYDVATVESALRDAQAALGSLRRSFALLPRWQPSVVHDTRLQHVNEALGGAVARVAADPLVGRWSGSGGLTIDFFPGGVLRQVKSGGETVGQYATVDGQRLALTSPKQSSTFSYRLDGPRLHLEGNGTAYDLNRSPPALLGLWRYPNGELFEFRFDGTWERTGVDGSLATGTFFVVSGPDSKALEVRFISDELAAPSRERRVELRVNGDELQVRPWDETVWYGYRRAVRSNGSRG